MRKTDVVCFSHLRWGFVYQRPNHLLERCARDRRVFFVEEPVHDGPTDHLEITEIKPQLYTVVPHLAPAPTAAATEAAQRTLLDAMLNTFDATSFVGWYYTPMALGVSRHLSPVATVYDCMDELSGFHGCSPHLRTLEEELFGRADLVFTGGQSLFEAKRGKHANVHAFPSSVDRHHFEAARVRGEDPPDQAPISGPRIGFFGVIDERMDLELLAGVAQRRPDWQLIMLGPVVKIDPASLPCRPNIHYLGQKTYAELPAYLAGWDVAMMPFALNDSTRFISPTKTLEYMAAGKEIVSTAICDVVRPFGECGLVRIASSPNEFVAAIEAALATRAPARVAAMDAYLETTSWDCTWSRMNALLEETTRRRL